MKKEDKTPVAEDQTNTRKTQLDGNEPAQTQTALQDTEIRYRSLFDSMREGVALATEWATFC